MQEYENNILFDSNTAVCAGLIANNETTLDIIWTLDTLDGTRIYASDQQYTGYRFMLDLRTLGLPEWTQILITAITSDDSKITSDVVLQYYSGTMHEAHFDLVITEENLALIYY